MSSKTQTNLSGKQPEEKSKDLVIEELKLHIQTLNHHIYALESGNKRWEKRYKSDPIIYEDEYLSTIFSLRYTLKRHRELLTESTKHRLVCSFCGAVKKKATMWYNMKTAEFLVLCFMGCQHFPNPFKLTKACIDGHMDAWIRIDPWQDYKKTFPKLRKQGLSKAETHKQARL